MSWHATPDPEAGDMTACDALEMAILAPSKDLGGFEVRRALPTAKRRLVGPFIFLDQMGPSVLAPGTGVDVRPHPHIGLSTLTYLFDGAMMHRDSLGIVQKIKPGEVNFMMAGRGIVHSERSPLEDRPDGPRLYGLQAWVASPSENEEDAPAFVHHSGDEQPVVHDTGARVRVIAGTMLGATAPLKTLSPTIFADVALAAGAAVPLDDTYEERAVYVLKGEVAIAGQTFGPGQLLVFRPGDRISIRATEDTRLAIIGGDALDGKRYIWWNFVSSRQDRIEQAKHEWATAKFDIVPGETEFIPLPA